jgi:DNA-binding GntR family transcriptional regulator
MTSGRARGQRAVAALVAQGLVVVKRSKGTYVVPPEDRPAG